MVATRRHTGGEETMKKALTALTIAALKPAAKAYYVGDSKQDGLRLRVAPDGKLTWNVTVRVKHGALLSTSLGRCDHECWFPRGTEPVGVRIKSWTAL